MKRHLLIQQLCALICAFRIRPLAGNEDTENLLANASEGGSPFAILQGDGFVIPYGEFPHKHGLQVFDRAAAEEMVAAHNSMLGKLVRLARGGTASYPVYIGHPDLPGSKDTDKRAWAWIEGMSAENDGLHLPTKWSQPGRELVENAHYKFYSPLWYFKKLGNGRIRPVALKSMGLTNEPNIPVPALANEMESEEVNDQQSPGNGEEAAGPVDARLLAILGLDESATLENCLDKISAMKQAADSKMEAEQKATEAETKVSEAETAKADAETKASEEETKRTEAENQLAAANGRVTDLEGRLNLAAANAVQAAVVSGRITPAEKDAKVSELLAANDFETALADLAKLPVKIKTQSETGDLGGAKSKLVLAANDEAAARRQERAQLVANELEAINPALPEGERRRLAWNRAQAKHPELFGKRQESSGAAA